MTTALATTNDQMSIAQENLGGALSIRDLTRVKMPAGGGISFEIPSPDGDTDVSKFIEGVIVAHSPLRQYFIRSESGNQLACSSNDGIVGIGTPGGSCAACPYNKWGSAANGGKGKACADKINVFIMRDDDVLPISLALPPTSIKFFRKFLVDLTLRKLPFYGVRVKVSLMATDNGKDKFSVAQFAMVKALDAEETLQHKAFKDDFMPVLLAAPPEIANQPDNSYTAPNGVVFDADIPAKELPF